MCHTALLSVILSAAKDLTRLAPRCFADAQQDWPIRLSSLIVLREQYVGFNEFIASARGDQNKSTSSSKKYCAKCALCARYLIKKRDFDNKEKLTILNLLKPKDDSQNMDDV